MKMIDALEDNDDVQSIYHNVNLPEEEDEDLFFNNRLLRHGEITRAVLTFKKKT